MDSNFSLVADEIDELIEQNDSTVKITLWGDELGNHYSKETIDKFRQASAACKMAGRMTRRIDWLVSGDDGENSFHSRWDKEARQQKLRANNKKGN